MAKTDALLAGSRAFQSQVLVRSLAPLLSTSFGGFFATPCAFRIFPRI
jgi:hypothetical protein